MTFNRDVNCYRATPRSLQTSKFGCYATLSTTRRTILGTWACYAVAVLSIVAATVALSGCGPSGEAAPERELVAAIDAETGCQYIRVSGLGGITPRLDSDGRPMCGKASKTKAVTLVTAR
ncbi:terminase small subunit [Ralstonia phage Darius]|uniref:Terminase small subunit n=2 Tax=Gervaisevirus gervaise TaxID=2846047 RepID=A0A7G5BAH3_9CAUD|nr:terminase small subunit [Ralstonia phage Gervaise]QMV32818.1 terminase small subunit [Ralstonia phage Darius]QMV33296.1 terminase small subunit [Ralstonia phage Gervaise]